LLACKFAELEALKLFAVDCKISVPDTFLRRDTLIATFYSFICHFDTHERQFRHQKLLLQKVQEV